MTLEIHRPLPPHQHHHQYENSGRVTMMSGKYSSSAGRVPLQSRNPNAMGPLGSFNNSSTEEYSSKDMANLNRFSNLESSHNENNKRLQTSSSYGNAAVRRNSSSEVRDGAEGGQTASRSSSVPRPMSAQRSQSVPSNIDEETVIIEEKRRKMNGEGYTIHRYLRGRMLGKGGFAKVYICTALDTNKAYAIKIVPKANLVKARARQKLQAEIKIHRTLKHSHVCEYKHFFEDRQNCYILLELCHNQSMNEMIKRRKSLSEHETAYLMKQLLQAVRYLHDNLVIHRDLKLGNLFLDKNMNVKVGDLGLATKLESADEKRKTICGTPNYIAPEVIQGDRASRGHSFEVDIWSMGVIMYTCLVGKPPYEAKDVKATYQRILANEYRFPKEAKISELAKDLIRSMLQSKPQNRPSLEVMAVHPWFTERAIPKSLPSSATHEAPQWEETEYGEIVLAGTTSNSDYPRKPNLPRSSSQRRPFAARDVNVVERGFDRSKPSKQTRDLIDVPGVVKNAISAVMSVGAKSPAPTPAFQVFDESQEPARSTPSMKKTPSSSRHPDDELVTRTAALSLRVFDSSPRQSTPTPSHHEGMTSPAAQTGHHQEADLLILHNMIERIETVLEITARRSYAGVNPDSPTLTAFSRGGPSKWVSRYVDYTSKYGLGFLLNDGSSGVYFNDSTKTILEPEGDFFQYIERKKSGGDSPRRGEPVISSHTLSEYPDDMQKKVTLLKHFRNYLIEQQKKLDDADGPDVKGNKSRSSPRQLVYLKKWVRTKHAIFFRLSDQTVQIVFYDHSEVLLTPDERHITYVDKQRNRNTYYLTDELVGCNAEIAKRLKYTKEILQQLVSGQKQR